MSTDVTSLSFKAGKDLTLGQEQMLSSSGLTPAYQKARVDFFESLVKERPDYDSVQLAVMERASYMHARIKQKEATGNYSSEQNYTMANKTFNETINLLHKLDVDKENREQAQRDFYSAVADSVKYAIKDLDGATQKNVLFLLQRKMEEVLNG